MNGLWLILAALAGLAAKPVYELISLVSGGLVKRHLAKHDTGLAQADTGAERCLEALAILDREVPIHWYRSRSPAPYLEHDDTFRRIYGALAQLEANLELMGKHARERMREVHQVLQVADQLGHESNAPYAHYESTEVITRRVVRYGRAVLHAHLRRDLLPEPPVEMAEYLLACKDVDSVFEEIWAPENEELRSARRIWREAHGLG